MRIILKLLGSLIFIGLGVLGYFNFKDPERAIKWSHRFDFHEEAEPKDHLVVLTSISGMFMMGAAAIFLILLWIRY
ncbi:hypothetical protein [Desnuesiella massiliensis]|uniref:hypothetical protein n=1 Tax=Desnuesiella massiliensis TaxID=1650662 RepID=UPI0006E39272|nr:hypothetical protein [Desnuesiella massiliensis]